MKNRSFIHSTISAATGAMLLPRQMFAWKKDIEMNGGFPLPAMAYSYGALSPFIDERTMRVHCSLHFQDYANNVNAAMQGTIFEGKSVEYLLTNIGPSEKILRHNGGGYYNHRLFFESLSATPQPFPEGDLNKDIRHSFGSLDNFQKEFSAAALSIFGAGWAWLIVDENDNLAITTTQNEDNPLMQFVDKKGWPLMAVDMWEHAHYLKYRQDRAAYIQAYWKVLDWAIIQNRYEEF